jgi:SAM-dependent methyltransferase
MFRNGAGFYYKVGESGINCILSALSLTHLPGVRRILDLPCGHGRVGRHLRCAFPDAELFFSDIDREGVDFCVSEFGGYGIYSLPDLTQARLPRGLDVIWVGSLFTHVNRSKTQKWLHFLADHLGAHGILVATFHGYFTARNLPRNSGVDPEAMVREFDEIGFGFAPYPRRSGAELDEYGFSIAKPSSIMDMADAIPGTRIVSYTERGWAGNHDVLALCRYDRLLPFETKGAPPPSGT